MVSFFYKRMIISVPQYNHLIDWFVNDFESRRWYVKRGWATLREDTGENYIIDLTIEQCQLNQFYSVACLHQI